MQVFFIASQRFHFMNLLSKQQKSCGASQRIRKSTCAGVSRYNMFSSRCRFAALRKRSGHAGSATVAIKEYRSTPGTKQISFSSEQGSSSGTFQTNLQS